MPFYCTISEDDCDATVFRRGNEHAVMIKVGYDGEEKGYSIVAGFSPAPPGDQEFYFALYEADSATDEERTIFDCLEVARIVEAKEDRQKIMGALLAAAQMLIDAVKPKRFTMSTRDGYLPEKALKKYFMLLKLFQDIGYQITAANQYNGMQAWWADLDP